MELNDLKDQNCLLVIDCFDLKLIGDEKKKYFCKIKDCNKSYSDKSCAIRHIRVNHKEFHNCVENNKKALKPQNYDLNKIEIRCKVDPNEIWNACIDLITVNALPLCFVEYPAFKRVIKPYVDSLDRQGIKLTINRKIMKEKIEKRAKKMKEIITSEVRGKAVCLMLDIASRFNRSILGINISYLVNNIIVVRTIGMHVLRFTQTAKNIANIIKKILSEFQIFLNQVLSVTTDNGKNLVKAVALLDAEYQEEKGAQEDSTDQAFINQINEIFESSDDEENIDSDIFDETYYLDLLANIRCLFEDAVYTDLIHGISCAAHCFHLIVTNAIKKSEETHQLLEKCRSLVKKLRTPTFRALIDENKLLHAKLDVPTRWNSICVMVRFLFFLINSEKNVFILPICLTRIA